MKPERYRLKITGIVQGVGFRPFIHTLAKSLFLSGWVINTSDGVEIEAEGPGGQLEAFVRRIREEAPDIAYIHKIDVEKLPFKGYEGFAIKESKSGKAPATFISPDVGICEDCRRELFDSGDYRYLYPFINCTNCGPRFTIVKDIPYDRANTTMDSFRMCDTCRSQYTDPDNRRYHAEPVSCEKCGPRLSLVDRHSEAVLCEDEAEKAAELLSKGYILAVKGLGGYHLACDAGNKEAVVKLRKRKHRDEKPFALMARDVETVLKYCHADPSEIALLTSSRKPVVLLRKRTDCSLPDEIAPGNPYLGFMLPYTPVHLLLFGGGGAASERYPGILVMTSGNMSSEPICFKDDEALAELGEIADYFLVNNRDIHIRTDDSVTRTFMGKEYLIRRARGYVPMPVLTGLSSLPQKPLSVLACGAEVKNTFCMNKGQEFYISHHIGDLENLETMESFEQGIGHFKKLFGIEPEAVAYDLHPDYLSTKYAVASGLERKIGVQHHKAHIASCMADNGLEGEVIGVAFDGTGFGEDGKIWGGEFFAGSYGGFKRAGHLEYARMPGGSAAVREPWRMAASYLQQAGLDMEFLSRYLPDGRAGFPDTGKFSAGLDAVCGMLASGFNSPYTSGMGRLFDAVSALAGCRYLTGYEGQAAIELEYAADVGYNGEYAVDMEFKDGMYVANTGGIIRGVVEDRKSSVAMGVISSRFHETIAAMVVKICGNIANDAGLGRVVLSGGVFQNVLLLSKCLDKLKSAGLEPYIHSRVPANDGGLSLGQAVIAMAQA